MRRAPARPVRVCFVRSCCTDVCSTALYYKACTKHFPGLLCTTKLAQSTSQDYSVLPNYAQSTSQRYFCTKACTKHFPVLLCTTKLAQSTSQDYSVLPNYAQSTSQRYFVLKLAQSTSQYYFVLQSLHKVRPRTTLYSQTMHKVRPSATLY